MKLDPRTVQCYFIGYSDHSKGYKFYNPTHGQRIVEPLTTKFLELDVADFPNLIPLLKELKSRTVVSLPLSVEPASVEPLPLPTQEAPDVVIDAVDPPVTEAIVQPQEAVIASRWSTIRKSAIPDDYVVYLGEHDFDIGPVSDPMTYKDVVTCPQSSIWVNAMQDEIASMDHNGVWELVELPAGCKSIGCKWVYKTKKDSQGRIERFKARLVAKGFTDHKEGIDYIETFSPISSKDSFRIIMALTAHFYLELHQMDVKTAFLNGDLCETVYMKQPEGFEENGKEHLVCELKKSIYELKQASRQWYLKYDEVITSLGFVENKLDHCIYLKTNGSKFIFLVLYVHDTLLASNDVNLLHETKALLSKTFEMKDLGEASFVLGIEIHRVRSQNLLGLSQRAYVDRVLKRFNMGTCKAGEVPVVKGDKLGKSQCPSNDSERKSMENIPYASSVSSLMYAQVCTRPDIAFIVGVLGRYLSNLGQAHWVAAKKVMRYLQRTKDYMLVYRKMENLEVLGYTDSDFAGCSDDLKSTSGYIFMMVEGAISWKSVKQTLRASSTMQAEFVACYGAATQTIWLKNFISGLLVVDSISRPIKILCDNNAAVFFSKNNKSSKGSKHIELKYLTVRDLVKNEDIMVEHIDTTNMLANPLTKGLGPITFKRHVFNMGIIKSFDVLG